MRTDLGSHVSHNTMIVDLGSHLFKFIILNFSFRVSFGLML